MAAAEIERIGEVNREEWVTATYVVEPAGTPFSLTARLQRHDPPLHFNHWSKAGTINRANSWRSQIEQGGHCYGAFSKGRLVGFVILGPVRTDKAAEIVALFIDTAFRRTGTGAELMGWATTKARANGATALFLASNPTISATDFYLKQGFEIVGLTAKHVVPGLSGDIMMAKRI